MNQDRLFFLLYLFNSLINTSILTSNYVNHIFSPPPYIPTYLLPSRPEAHRGCRRSPAVPSSGPAPGRTVSPVGSMRKTGWRGSRTDSQNWFSAADVLRFCSQDKIISKRQKNETDTGTDLISCISTNAGGCVRAGRK